MDPKAALDSAERALKAGRYHDAGDFLSNYWEWRRHGGFEPRGGDRRAERLGAKLSKEWEGGESGWGEAGGVEGEGYDNPSKEATWGALGGGAGALLLGPIGAAGGAYLAAREAKKKKKKPQKNAKKSRRKAAKKNPKKRRLSPALKRLLRGT